MYYAVNYLKDLNVRKNYSIMMPNKFNCSFDLYYMIIVGMLAYIPVFPELYGHMLKQRKKMLAPKTIKAE